MIPPGGSKLAGDLLAMREFIRARLPREEFVPGKSKIPLQEVMFGEEEILEALNSMLSTQVVMEKKVAEFEQCWAQWLGCRHAVASNSGTSALLLAMLWLKYHPATPQREEVLIPALTWSTTLSTALIAGLKPVLVDVSLKNLCVDSFAHAVTPSTLAMVPVHLMGHSCNMTNLMREARESSAWVIEDACEAVGTRWNQQRVGTFGQFGCFSFMFAHHLSTMEGGMTCASSDAAADVLKAMRAHGWVRDSSVGFRKGYEERYPEIDKRFLFCDPGLNLRPTELVGAFGIHQLKRAEEYIAKRRVAFQRITERLRPFTHFVHLFEEQPGEFLSPFSYPMVLREEAPFKRAALMNFLEENLIETRMLVGGNLARQPFAEEARDRIQVRGSLKNADLIHTNGLVFGINQSTDDAKIGYIAEVFQRFFKRW
ncbi:MAG: DegT/DnrJ/EryC1/StrS family aminotransferase [Candidatus Omnitrophica bacterium]|nr:DegT/DnrJ/EryC1/StrS family aminotransferase [Candidatus Omnitrophota bacterium]